MNSFVQRTSEIVVSNAEQIVGNAPASAAIVMTFAGFGAIEAPMFDEGKITWQKHLRDTLDEGIQYADVVIAGARAIRKGLAEDWQLFGSHAPEDANRMRRAVFYLTHLKSDLTAQPDEPRCIWREIDALTYDKQEILLQQSANKNKYDE